jgi:hypothetical protein
MIDAIRGAKLALDRAFLVLVRVRAYCFKQTLLYRCHFQATAISDSLLKEKGREIINLLVKSLVNSIT